MTSSSRAGLLLAVYGIRRPTKDIDAEAIAATVTPDHITQVVHGVTAADVPDGMTFDLATMSVQEIREQADYPGLRMRINAHLGSQKVVVAWDISTGDPIIPPPRLVKVPRVLGDDIEMLGYAPETTVAQKGVTILERGITSTRWRDFVDIVQLAERHGIHEEELLQSARAVARYRNVELRPITSVIAGYGAVGQPKWAAWRRKEGVKDLSEEHLDDQIAKVAAILDPVFSHGSG